MSPKASPLLGYNNNVRHKGHVFHIQTEDSGVRYGHIITHLFMDGGRILKSVKTSYAEYVASERRTEIVREMMKQQHKAMFIALRDGKFDGFVDGGAPQPSRSSGASSTAADVASAPAPEVRGAAALSAPADAASHPPLAAIRPPRSSAVPSAVRTTTDLPPPPPDLLRLRATTSAPRPSEALAAATSTASRSPLPRDKPSPLPVDHAAADRRYAPTRPASIFGQARPAQGKTIFGEDPMSDKSLDEVILSYLSAELDEKK